MAEELKPCPVCGASRGLYVLYDDHDMEWLVFCDNCKTSLHSEMNDTREDAIETWNRRAGGECEQRRTRRTCRVECYPPGYEDNLHYEVCSECGTILTASRPGDGHAARASYCPSCGARVVEEASDDAD